MIARVPRVSAIAPALALGASLPLLGAALSGWLWVIGQPCMGNVLDRAVARESEPAGARDVDTASSAPAARPALRHEAALDGLRGLAVAAVVIFHLDHLGGGFLGVDLFFVLSGFLITSLLVSEERTRGAIRLGRFWARRARRRGSGVGTADRSASV